VGAVGKVPLDGNSLAAYHVVPPIPITRGVWELYGHTKAELSKIGKSVPDIDLLIASTAKYYNMVLIANDQHMQHLPSSFVQKNWAIGKY
jgi:predicted nucleic acid-binding protein